MIFALRDEIDTYVSRIVLPLASLSTLMTTVASPLQLHIQYVRRWGRSNCDAILSKIDARITNNAFGGKLRTIQTMSFDARHLLYGLLVCVAILWFVVAAIRRRAGTTKPSTPELEKRSPFKAPPRPLGGKKPIYLLSYPVVTNHKQRFLLCSMGATNFHKTQSTAIS